MLSTCCTKCKTRLKPGLRYFIRLRYSTRRASAGKCCRWRSPCCRKRCQHTAVAGDARPAQDVYQGHLQRVARPRAERAAAGGAALRSFTSSFRRVDRERHRRRRALTASPLARRHSWSSTVTLGPPTVSMVPLDACRPRSEISGARLAACRAHAAQPEPPSRRYPLFLSPVRWQPQPRRAALTRTAALAPQQKPPSAQRSQSQCHDEGRRGRPLPDAGAGAVCKRGDA